MSLDHGPYNPAAGFWPRLRFTRTDLKLGGATNPPRLMSYRAPMGDVFRAHGKRFTLRIREERLPFVGDFFCDIVGDTYNGMVLGQLL